MSRNRVSDGETSGIAAMDDKRDKEAKGTHQMNYDASAKNPCNLGDSIANDPDRDSVYSVVNGYKEKEQLPTEAEITDFDVQGESTGNPNIRNRDNIQHSTVSKRTVETGTNYDVIALTALVPGDTLEDHSLINSSQAPSIVYPTSEANTGADRQSTENQLIYNSAAENKATAKESTETKMPAAKLNPDTNDLAIIKKQPRQSIPGMTGDLNESTDNGNIGVCGYILWGLSLFVIVITMPVSLCLCIKVVQEYERAVIFRLGRLLSGGAKGPGLFFIVPCVDSYSKVDLRTVSFDVPPQEVLTKDSVTVAVDAVVYYRVSNATISVINVEDANRSTRLLAQTTLRNVLGTKNLSEILSDREQISQTMQDSLDIATDPWGIKVERVEVKDVRLPVQLQRAMAAEAEAARDARAKVIAAEGEQKASRALKEAADVISQSPAALQLRYLQTLNAISAEKNSTIIFPLPIDMMQAFIRR